MTEQLIIALAVIFVAAGLLSLVANQFDLSPIPFYILAGLLIGGFEYVTQEEVLVLAQWGIAFLVFVFGIRLDFANVQTVLRDAEFAASIQLLVVGPIAFAIGYAFGDLFGFGEPVRNALYFSAAAVLSSSLVGGEVLRGEIRENLVHGRLASSIHFFDDLVALTLLLVITADAFTADAITSQLGYGVLFIAAGLFLYRHGFQILVRLADGDGELVLVGSISILIAFLAAAEYVGLSIVVGAFAAGIAIRDDGTNTLEVRNGIDSIADFFGAIFFVTIGALVSIPTVEVALVAAALVGVVLILNPLVHTLAFMYEGYDSRTAFLASSSLNQVSEFSLIIAIQALLLGTIVDAVFEAIILAAVVTMALTPAARRWKDRIFELVVSRVFRKQRTRKVDERSEVDGTIDDHVIVLGYGRQGRRIAERLEELDRPYVVIENDPMLWDELRANCRSYVLGDAMSAYSWEKAGIDRAALVVSTVDHRELSETICTLETDADLLLRSESSAEAEQLLDAGAAYVTVPNVVAGRELVEIVEALSTGEREISTLKREHLEMLDAIEHAGFASRYARY
ncbi:cation:proton antiporter [Halorubrum vacuolatum]|uniref:Monovalent cation:H+ antiporter-2, CPA2 family n=1 Tax=Halorubrum vacuolatum TaxID=63740 RepID=A0A238UVE6_HALVU|nr:cation:proton antiporter [Halorubrum vacuolatum]SNR26195.1 monovalent cation:H+ antiporter-2, CPA2 family [Halorubrum vacuolatum]